MNSPGLSSRIEAAKRAVSAETALLHREFGLARTEIKHDGTRVTAIDIAISQHIQAAILNAFPDDQFFSEELTPTAVPVPATVQFCWVLDPIDGTNNYASGISHCAISLALLENGMPVYGVIYDLARRVTIHGGPGFGVWDGEKTARVRPGPAHAQSLVGFHSPTHHDDSAAGARVMGNFKIRGLGSSTLHLAYVAVGLLDGVVEFNNKVWDIAAAAALMSEAGGELHYLSDPPFPLKEFSSKSPRVQYVGGNPEMSRTLLDLLGR